MSLVDQTLWRCPLAYQDAIEIKEGDELKEVEEAAKIYATLQGDQVGSITWRKVNEGMYGIGQIIYWFSLK